MTGKMVEAGPGRVFVVTELGYRETPDNIKHERQIGKPLKNYEKQIPIEWLESGYVQEETEI